MNNNAKEKRYEEDQYKAKAESLSDIFFFSIEPKQGNVENVDRFKNNDLYSIGYQ